MGTECAHHRHGNTVYGTWKGKRIDVLGVLMGWLRLYNILGLLVVLKVLTCVYTG